MMAGLRSSNLVVAASLNLEVISRRGQSSLYLSKSERESYYLVSWRWKGRCNRRFSTAKFGTESTQKWLSLGRLPRRACKVKVSGRTRVPEDFRIKLVRFGRHLGI
jgi:hypothetical protein